MLARLLEQHGLGGRAPHRIGQRVQRRLCVRHHPRLLRLPHSCSDRRRARLVRHRLQLPRRPLRPNLRGTRRRDHEHGRRRPHRWLQQPEHRGRRDRQLRHGSAPGGPGRIHQPAHRVEVLGPPHRGGRLGDVGLRRRRVEVSGGHRRDLSDDLWPPRRRADVMSRREPVRHAARHPVTRRESGKRLRCRLAHRNGRRLHRCVIRRERPRLGIRPREHRVAHDRGVDRRRGADTHR